MDSVDICVATTTTTAETKRVDKRKYRGWQERLRRRNTAAQPPTMQSGDKRGPKQIAEEWERNTTWPSSKKSPQSHDGAKSSGNILRFRCSQCTDNVEFLPRDFVGHFEETHRGTAPVFPCHMCTFSAHEFSSLEVHLLSHKETFSSCDICKDNIQRTSSEFTTHLTTHHSQNGKYSCEKCERFSTGDARVFLEHIYLHNSGLERGGDVERRSKTTTRTFHCPHCGYEAPQKRLITKHVNAAHVGQNGNQKRKAADPITVKPSDSTPNMKHRLTRNTVREMCWLSQDCLSLPGRDFLDKYCSLSDPKTTLEETQQFLMRSTGGDTGGQKWTKALQTVLSNVPQDMNLHPKSENGIVSNSGFSHSSKDLTVLTVKNKITVPQNGTTYAKRLKTMAPSSEKGEEAVSSESAAVDAHCVSDPSRQQSNSNDQTPGPQTQTPPNDDASISAQNEPAECTRIQENRENQEVRVGLEYEEHGRKYEEPKNDRVDASEETKPTNESDEQMSVSKAPPKNKSRKGRRCRRKTGSKRRKGRASKSDLKLLLKKNPVKCKQWVSQSPLPGDASLDARLPNPHATLEEAKRFLQRASSAENDQKPKTDRHNAPKAAASTSQSEPEEEHLNTSSDLSALLVENETSVPPDGTAKPSGLQNEDGKDPRVLTDTTQDARGETERSSQLSETEASRSTSECQSDGFSENPPLHPAVGDGASRGDDVGNDRQVPDNEESSAVDGAAAPHRNDAESSPVPHPVITPQAQTPSEDSRVAVSLEQRDRSVPEETEGEPPTDARPELLSTTDRPRGRTIPEEASPASVHPRQPDNTRTVERTLKLIAVSPTQLIKRPLGEQQPVVVLNHPDADTPEVTKIMEVVHRYRGEVQKVILSRKTLSALPATGGEVPTGAQTPSPGHVRLRSSVQERFILKLKLRRMSRRKYEVVRASSPTRGHPVKFRCWFCGRTFASQDAWLVHRQRHLMEWKTPNCEYS